MSETSVSMNVLCPQGLQLREAFHLVKQIRNSPAEITVEHDGYCADAKSLWAILQLGVLPGARVKITAAGSGAGAALEDLRLLFDLPGAPVLQGEPLAQG